MQITLNQPLKFIQKENLTKFHLEQRNGMWVVFSDGFTQFIKQSEYKQIMASVGAPVKEEEKIIEKDEPKSDEPKFKVGGQVVFSTKNVKGIKGEIVKVDANSVRVKAADKIYIVNIEKIEAVIK